MKPYNLTHPYPHSPLLTLLLGSLALFVSCDEKQQADEMAGGVAGEMTGEVAGEIAGELAGELAGDLAGEQAGEQAGEVAGDQAGSDLLPEPIPELNLTGCSADQFGQSELIISTNDLTQIHPDATWDGEAFWITWNIANDEGKFETWAGRFSCSLTPLIPPFAIEQSQGMNDLDPSIAVHGDVVIVIWNRDNSFADGATYNLSTRIAAFHADTGEPIYAPRTLEVSQSDVETPAEALATPPSEVAEGNRWMSDIEARPEGGFVLTGSWGDPSVESFRVYLVHLDAQGEVQGSAWLADSEGRNQVYPQLSITPYGVIDLLWQGDREGEGAGFHTRAWRDMTTGVLNSYYQDWISADLSRGPHLPHNEGLLALPPSGNELGTPWVVGTREGGAGFTVVPPDRDGGGISSRRALNGVRFIAGGLVGYQQESGSAQEVWYRPLSEEGLAGEIDIWSPTPNAAAYPLSVTHIEGGILMLWAEGSNPNFKIRASLIPLD